MRRKELWTKTLTAVLAAAMVSGVSPAVQALAVTGSQVAADGTYTSTKHVTRTQEDVDNEDEWNEYDVKVDLTVKDGKITDIIATPENGYESGNSSYFGKAYNKSQGIKTKLVGQAATEDTINSWDTVSQATRTSDAVKAAALEAIQSASEAGATTPDTPEEEARYITMNVPYTAFYAAYGLTDKAVWEVEDGVDAVSTATTKKFKGTTGLAKGTYNDGTYIKGVTIPVKVSAEDYKKLTTGLADTADYYFTDLADAPAAYSELTVGSDGSYSFSKFADSTLTIDGAKVSEAEIDGGYGDYQISLEGITPDGKVTVNGEAKTLTTYGAILNTSAGTLGMTCLENLWYGTRVPNMEIAWSIKGGKGLCRAHGKGDPFYQFDANGATLNSVTLITDQGLITINDGQKLPEYYTGDLSALKYSLENESKELSISGIPADLKDVKISVSGGLATEKEVTDGKVELEKAPVAGTLYTITISSSNYPDITRTMSTPITKDQISTLNKLIAKAEKTTGYEENQDLKEHVQEARELIANTEAKSADAAELIGELEDKIKATYPTANAIATLKGAKLDVQLDGIDLSALENPTYKLTYKQGRNESTLTSGKLTGTSITLDKEPVVGTAYTLTISSDNYQDIKVKVTAENVDAASEYSYVYVGMNWAEYWKNEGVMNAGSTENSDVLDSHNEYDKGAFDTVTRATGNHGLHRGNFQCNAIVEDTDGNTHTLVAWVNGNALFDDGKEYTRKTENGVTTFTATDGTSFAQKDYKVTGLKYVPVKVKTSDLEALKEKYTVVENGETLTGGYTENSLSAYSVTAEVTENTNGLKEATKTGDGFEFSARKTDGTDSGIKGQALKEATNVEPQLRKKGDKFKPGTYGEFIRLDILGAGYGDLGSNMQSVKWEYYGTDENNTTPLATYGTKFAADNWMHKTNGIQLGLTESARCELPQGTDGTGRWKVTVSALGYKDYTCEFTATEDNLAVATPVSEATKASLQAKVDEADKLNESDYTEESWANLKMELQESKDLLAKTDLLESEAAEQITHLTEAIDKLVKKDTSETSEYTYAYVGMTWAEYWKNEGVMNAGSTESSDVLDSHNEYDKGAFDTVTRATGNHGLHRGNFQCNAIVEDTDGNTHALVSWVNENALFDDGKEYTRKTENGITTFTATDGTSFALKDHKVTGLKYVPVKVKTSDLEALKEKYTVVENGETLTGGYTEGSLSAYSVTAEVTENTNGLKEATKTGDGFEFSARKTDGTDSGIKGQALKEAANVTPTLRTKADRGKAPGVYGEFIRLDILGDYGDLGSNMQSVKWEYYGTDENNTTPLATYGTKFASDNWIHKLHGIQLGLTESARCELPQGTDGTGRWKVTISALGYKDYTYKFTATEDNLAVATPVSEATKASLQAKVDEADKLNESDYTEESWANLKMELQESKDLLAKTDLLESEAAEQITHLTEAIKTLVKKESPVSVDTSALEAAITEAKALKEADYTSDSWKAFQSALTDAQKALEAKESQDAVDNALNVLNKAKSALKKAEEPEQPEKVNTASLEKAIADVKALKESDYTEESWKALQSALTNAQKALDAKESQDAVDKALNALNEAKSALKKAEEPEQPEEVNTASLEKAIADAKALKESDYTEESWKALQSALTDAQKALEAKESQDAVDNAANKLNNVIRALKKKATNGAATSSTNKGSTTGSGTSATDKGSVKTGDTANVLGLLGAAVASLGAAGTSLKLRRKNKKK